MMILIYIEILIRRDESASSSSISLPSKQRRPQLSLPFFLPSPQPPSTLLQVFFFDRQNATCRASESSEHPSHLGLNAPLPPKRRAHQPFLPSLLPQVAPPSPKPTASQKALAAAFLAHQVEELQSRVDGMNMRGRGRGGGLRGGGRGGRGGARGSPMLDAGFA